MKIFKREYRYFLFRKYFWLFITALIGSIYYLLVPVIKNENIMPIIAEIDNVYSGILNLMIPYGLDSLNDKLIYFNNILNILMVIVVIYSINIGLQTISREIDSGSFRYLYTAPISRSEIVIYKTLANIANLFIFIIISLLLLIYSYSRIFDIGYMDLISKNILVFINMGLMGLMSMSIGTLISTIINSRSINQYIGILLSFIIIVLDIVTKYRGHRSIVIHLFDPNLIVSTFIFLGVASILLLLTNFIFNKKDLI